MEILFVDGNTHAEPRKHKVKAKVCRFLCSTISSKNIHRTVALLNPAGFVRRLSFFILHLLRSSDRWLFTSLSSNLLSAWFRHQDLERHARVGVPEVDKLLI